MSKKFNKKQLKKMNKSVAGGGAVSALAKQIKYKCPDAKPKSVGTAKLMSPSTKKSVKTGEIITRLE